MMRNNKYWGMLLLAELLALLICFMFSSCSGMSSAIQCKDDPKEISHSCPKEGHGPCYLCNDPKFKVIYGRKDILNKGLSSE